MESEPGETTSPRSMPFEIAKRAVVKAINDSERTLYLKKYRKRVRDEINSITDEIEGLLLVGNSRTARVEGKLARRVDCIPVLVDYLLVKRVPDLSSEDIPSITEGRLATEVIANIIEEQQDRISQFGPNWDLLEEYLEDKETA